MPSSASTTPRELRVGLLGFGFIGKVHAFAYQTIPWFYNPLPCRTRITHVVTSRDSTAQAAADLCGPGTIGTTDAAAVLENPDIDIVNICTPNHLHRDALLTAMRHGKHIYCDKPLVCTAAEAADVRAALPDYRGTAQMTFNNRFAPAMQRARQLVEQGFVGDVLEFRVCYLHASNIDRETPLKWKLSAAAGGGVIADLLSHTLDLCDWLVGTPTALLAATHIAYPDRPSASDPTRRVAVDAEDNVMLLARLANGAVGHLSAGKLTTGAEDEVRVELHGTRGAIRYNSMDPHHLETYSVAAPAAPLGGMRGWTRIDCGQRFNAPAIAFPGPKQSLGWLRIHAACLHQFLADVAAGRPGDPGLPQGLHIQHLMECTRQSAASGTWVTV